MYRVRDKLLPCRSGFSLRTAGEGGEGEGMAKIKLFQNKTCFNSKANVTNMRHHENPLTFSPASKFGFLPVIMMSTAPSSPSDAADGQRRKSRHGKKKSDRVSKLGQCSVFTPVLRGDPKICARGSNITREEVSRTTLVRSNVTSFTVCYPSR